MLKLLIRKFLIKSALLCMCFDFPNLPNMYSRTVSESFSQVFRPQKCQERLNHSIDSSVVYTLMTNVFHWKLHVVMDIFCLFEAKDN